MGRMHSASIYHQVRVFGGRIKGATLRLHPKCPSYSVAALMDLLNGTVFWRTAGDATFNACLGKSQSKEARSLSSAQGCVSCMKWGSDHQKLKAPFKPFLPPFYFSPHLPVGNGHWRTEARHHLFHHGGCVHHQRRRCAQQAQAGGDQRCRSVTFGGFLLQ